MTTPIEQMSKVHFTVNVVTDVTCEIEVPAGIADYPEALREYRESSYYYISDGDIVDEDYHKSEPVEATKK